LHQFPLCLTSAGPVALLSSISDLIDPPTAALAARGRFFHRPNQAIEKLGAIGEDSRTPLRLITVTGTFSDPPRRSVKRKVTLQAFAAAAAHCGQLSAERDSSTRLVGVLARRDIASQRTPKSLTQCKTVNSRNKKAVVAVVLDSGNRHILPVSHEAAKNNPLAEAGGLEVRGEPGGSHRC